MKRLFVAFINLFRIPTDNMPLVRAQFDAFSKQIPLLYFILTTNSLAAAWTFTRFAPDWLGVYFPSALCTLCGVRCVWWWRSRHKVFSDTYIIKAMRATTGLAVGLTLGFTIWALLLYPYGDAYARGQVVFCLALTVIGCVFCLMHLRPAALAVTLFANIPFVLFFFLEGHDSLKAISINLALVSVAMIMILMVYSRDFARLVESQAETRRLSDENFRIANLDSLTDLPNRRWFFTELERYHAEAVASGRSFAVGIIDLDGFKPVNDTYGHMTGDRVLAEVGRRLSRTAGKDLTLARLGGDEFGFIMANDPTEDRLKAFSTTLIEAIRLPFAIGGSNAHLGASIGVARYPDTAQSPESLFERADYALYHAKRTQRGQVVVFSSRHEEQIRSHGVIEQALQAADFDNEMSLVYQPIVDTRTGRASTFEALARWNSPILGAVGPGDFIPVAERNGQVRALSLILLGKALRAAAQWPQTVRISFNLSAHDISQAESVIQIIALINQSGVSPKRIDFEITETSISYDFQQARAAVIAFRALGVGISLDDFGTGYSSLSHVHRLALDKIKVDRSFVADVTTNPVSHKIVKSLSALCTDMGLDCVLEGVETAAQLEALTDLGCTFVQGYYFARPMPEEDVQHYLESEDKLPSRRRMGK
ncbi:bifunctional diguanylate cyclase/phosphodiesterase [Asticcacaulis sp. AC402]|uniref:putative bifunctional diguanylate cyclase/phosphodiesterase n=1 Tax=Asticcacaulis sp. AC402 TaxID=1282361 RepID=UPI0003C3B7E6|nr:EAL domain-containing protein [Asticcacaulis sp. AC402]ESQ76134.1 histidine kinase [Asticcacaulis sp. AC402]